MQTKANKINYETKLLAFLILRHSLNERQISMVSSVGGDDCAECSQFIVFDPVTLTGCVGFLVGAVGPEIFVRVCRLGMESEELLCVLENRRRVCSVSSTASSA